MNKNKIAYHFVGNTLLDGRPVPADGEWLEHADDIELCKDPFDALQDAPGDILCMVEYDSRRRRIIKRVNAELLREFARWAALQVIDEWDAPDIVRQYLITGDEKIRVAAWNAAWNAREAAWNAREAAWDAAWNAIGADADADAARDAAWDAAKAARDAASATTKDAAWDTARAAQRARFADMVNAAFEEI